MLGVILYNLLKYLFHVAIYSGSVGGSGKGDGASGWSKT